MDIPQHPAVKVDDEGLADWHPDTKFKRGKKGVLLRHATDQDKHLLGLPVRLKRGRYMIPTRFGRRRFTGALGVGHIYFLLGTTVSKAKAEDAYRIHPSTINSTLERIPREEPVFDPDPIPEGAELVREIGNDRYYVIPDGSAEVRRHQYDHPTIAWHLKASASDIRTIIQGGWRLDITRGSPEALRVER